VLVRQAEAIEMAPPSAPPASILDHVLRARRTARPILVQNGRALFRCHVAWIAFTRDGAAVGRGCGRATAAIDAAIAGRVEKPATTWRLVKPPQALRRIDGPASEKPRAPEIITTAAR
jgi:hypothetical protein